MEYDPLNDSNESGTSGFLKDIFIIGGILWLLDEVTKKGSTPPGGNNEEDGCYGCGCLTLLVVIFLLASC